MSVKKIARFENVEDKVVLMHHQKVLIDSDAAELYGVETKRINEAVKNNPDRFLDGYIQVLTKEDKLELVENFDQSKKLKYSTVTLNASYIIELLMKYLHAHSEVKQAILFGSRAKETANAESDVDLAVSLDVEFDCNCKKKMVEDIAMLTGLPVDLIDLNKVGEPLLGQILQHGKRLVGDNAMFARLLSKHLLNQADFMPYRKRILAERREAWIG